MAAPFTVFPDTTTETRGDIARSIEGFPSGTSPERRRVRQRGA
jgi:hypothetical protein